jgi:hypothetical protein
MPLQRVGRNHGFFGPASQVFLVLVQQVEILRKRWLGHRFARSVVIVPSAIRKITSL